MQIIHLPTPTVDFLNCVYRFKKGIEFNMKEVITGYRSFLTSVNEWFETRKQVVITGEEQTLISNIQFLLQKREEELGKLEASGFETDLFEAYAKLEFELGESLARANAEREKQQVSPIPVANDFLLAAWAHINKDAAPDVAKGFVNIIRIYLKNLEEDYNGIAHILKPEVKEEFSLAFDITKGAVHEIEDAFGIEDKHALDLACDKLKGGFELLNYYLEWQKNQDLALMQKYCNFKIPFVAYQLEILLSDAKEGRVDSWSEKVETVAQASLMELNSFWAHASHQLFVKPSRRQELVEKIEEGLKNLKESLQALKELTPERLENYENCLKSLSELFTQLEQETLRWNSLIGTGGELLGESVKGIYYGTLPDFTLRDITNYLRTSPLVSYFEDGIVDLETYLDDFHRDHLLWGLEKLLTAIPQKAEAGEEAAATLLCPYCGTANKPSVSYCTKCNARLMFKGAMMMECPAAPAAEDASINIMDLPLPSTAEPLVRLLHHVEKDQYDKAEAETLINNFIASLNQMVSLTKGDKLLSSEQQDKLAEILEHYAKAAQEAQAFLETQDPDSLRRSLKRVSEASIKMKKHMDEEAERIAKQESSEAAGKPEPVES